MLPQEAVKLRARRIVTTRSPFRISRSLGIWLGILAALMYAPPSSAILGVWRRVALRTAVVVGATTAVAASATIASNAAAFPALRTGGREMIPVTADFDRFLDPLDP